MQIVQPEIKKYSTSTSSSPSSPLTICTFVLQVVGSPLSRSEGRWGSSAVLLWELACSERWAVRRWSGQSQFYCNEAFFEACHDDFKVDVSQINWPCWSTSVWQMATTSESNARYTGMTLLLGQQNWKKSAPDWLFRKDMTMLWKEIGVPKLSLGNYAAAEINGSGAFLTITCRGKWSRRDTTLYRLI